MNYSRKFLSVFVTLAMCIGLLPGFSTAAWAANLDGLTTFTFDGNTVTVTDGSDGNYEVVVYDDTGTESDAETTADSSGNKVYSVPADGDGELLVYVKKKGGSYVFQGEGSGSIGVKKEATEDATLYLNGLTLTSSFTSVVTVNKDSTAACTIYAVENTVNTLTDAAYNNDENYIDNIAAENAVMKFQSSTDVTITGGGTIQIYANGKNGIKSNDLLTISGEVILSVEAVGDAIEGNLTISGGYITAESTNGNAIAIGDEPYTVTITGGYFAGAYDTTTTADGYGTGTVYGCYVADGYGVYDNADETTSEEYPCIVVSTSDAFLVTGDSSGYTYSSSILTISEGGEYTVTMNTYAGFETTATDRIKIESSDDVTLTIKDINITSSSDSPLRADKGNLTLILEGDSYLTATGNYSPGLTKQSDYILMITSYKGDGYSDGILTATGGLLGAGIGGGAYFYSGTEGYYGYNSNNITIAGGTVNATGGDGGAGIGGGGKYSPADGYGGSGTVTITGGTVNAVGGNDGAGIGGGGGGDDFGGAGTVTISGGMVTASGGVPIGGGGGYIDDGSSNVTITGGYFADDDYNTEATEDGYGTGTVYGCNVADGYGVYANEDETTSEDYPCYVAEIPKAFLITGDESGYTYENNLLMITEGGEYTVTMNTYAGFESTDSDTIKISSGDDVTVTIADLDITNDSAPPIEIDGTGDVTLKLSGENVLESTSGTNAGLQLSSADLIITSADGDGKTTGSLDASSTGGSAGIGGADGSNMDSSITINGGTVSGSSELGAGIGGGSIGDMKDSITINGGTASGTSSYGAGIGIGQGGTLNGSVVITGGNVSGSSWGGAGIGIGQSSYWSNGIVSISGGYITAESASAEAIGSGTYCGSDGTITITGGYFAGAYDITTTVEGYGTGTVYDHNVASGYAVYDNVEDTKGDYPARVLSSDWIANVTYTAPIGAIGEAPADDTDYSYGEKVTVNNTLPLTNGSYGQTGWSLSSTDTAAVTTFEISGNTTLYPVFARQFTDSGVSSDISLTYGEAITDIDLSGYIEFVDTNIDTDGQFTFAVADGSELPAGLSFADGIISGIPEAATTSAVSVSFTVTDNNPGYITLASLDSAPAAVSATLTLTFTVAKADSSIDTAPAAVEDLVYTGSAQELVSEGTASGGTVNYSLTGADGSWSEDIPTAASAGEYTVYYKVAGDGNHNDTEAQSVDVTIAPLPIEVTWDHMSFVYDGSEKSVTAAAANIVSGDTVKLTCIGNTATEVGSYTAEITDVDNANYTLTGASGLTHVWSIAQSSTSGELSTYNGETLTSAFTYGDIITVKAALNAVNTANTLNLFAFSEFIEGSAAVFNGDTQISDAAAVANGITFTLEVDTADIGAGEHTLTLKYYGDDNMAETEIDFDVTVARAVHGTPAGLTVTQPDENTSTGTVTGVTTAMEYSVDGGDTWEAVTEDPLVVAPGTVLIRYAETDNYSVGAAVEIEISASDPSYTTPADLTAVYGETLADVELPAADNGIWTWETESLGVGDVGVNTFKAVFMPSDSNHNTVYIDVSVTVVKAVPEYTVPTGLTAVYGDTLAGVVLSDGWAWENASQSVGDVGTNTFTAVFTPDDTDNYETVTADVEVTVSAAEPDPSTEPTTEPSTEPSTEPTIEPAAELTVAEVPTASRVKRGNTLSKSTLSGGSVIAADGTEISGTWAWADGTETMSKTGTYERTAVFTADDEAYGTVEVAVTVTVYTSSGGGSSSGSTSSSSSGATAYAVTAEELENGNVSFNSSTAQAGATVTITVTPDDGYETDTVTVTDASGNEIEVTTNGDNTYLFVMPSSDVSVNAAFKEAKTTAGSETNSADDTHDCPSEKFTDVDTSLWYHEYIDYVLDNGLMVGITDTAFEPNTATTRAMIVTILYRLEGEPSTGGESEFTDVAAGAWYADAVKWAADNGIVLGHGDGTFAPNDIITREQTTAVLYRYADYKGMDTKSGADLSFADTDEISEYALAAIQWACGAGLINGKDNNTLDPKGGATRAETAAMLMRFIEAE